MRVVLVVMGLLVSGLLASPGAAQAATKFVLSGRPVILYQAGATNPDCTAAGEVVPRDIITSFTCRFNGAEIFRADLFPAIAANPFLSFFTTASESGRFEFEWIGDNGFVATASAAITVE